MRRLTGMIKVKSDVESGRDDGIGIVAKILVEEDSVRVGMGWDGRTVALWCWCCKELLIFL